MLKVWRGDSMVLEVPLQAAEDVGTGPVPAARGMPRRELLSSGCSAPASRGYNAPAPHGDRGGRDVCDLWRDAACADDSSPSKAGRAPASRPMRRCSRSGCARSASAWCSRASPAARRAPRSSATCCCRAPPSRSAPHAEAILFAAARDDHVRHTIEPALERGRWVICDRFSELDARLSGHARQRGPEADPGAGARHGRRSQARPDLHSRRADRDRARARAGKRRGDGEADRFEGEALEFHEKLRDAFRVLALSEPDRCVLIDASAPRADGRGADLEGRQ